MFNSNYDDVVKNMTTEELRKAISLENPVILAPSDSKIELIISHEEILQLLYDIETDLIRGISNNSFYESARQKVRQGIKKIGGNKNEFRNKNNN